jgi:signal transduction histidine kinase
MRAALDREPWDLVLSDYSMPNFSGSAALKLLRDRGTDIPFIIVSGTIGEDTAVEALKAGASDFLVKGRLTRLGPSVERELREARLRQERNVLERQLQHAQKMESLGRLAGGIAHDFNNVLSVIRGFSDLLLDVLEEPHARDVREIRKASETGQRLTRQLMAFSRQQPIEPAPLDLNESVTTMAAILQQLLGGLVQLETRLGAIGCVWADRGQVEQILVNLTTNARDAMPEGGRCHIDTSNATVTPVVASRENVREGAYVMLAVSDTGVGMPPEIQARIFEPFFTAKAPEQGTGFGLATVYGIVRQSNGFIDVSSTVGQGTTFRIFLPRVDSQVKSADTHENGE